MRSARCWWLLGGVVLAGVLVWWLLMTHHSPAEGIYLAGSNIPDEEALGGFGKWDNMPKDLAGQKWGEAGSVSLIAFPDEDAAYLDLRGFALRLVNRTDKPVALPACNSQLYLVQEALDREGKWRPIETFPDSGCGNSYHRVFLDNNQYWEFPAPRYQGWFKTRIRFRLELGRSSPHFLWIAQGLAEPKRDLPSPSPVGRSSTPTSSRGASTPPSSLARKTSEQADKSTRIPLFLSRLNANFRAGLKTFGLRLRALGSELDFGDSQDAFACRPRARSGSAVGFPHMTSDPHPPMTDDDPLPDLVRGLQSEFPVDRLRAARNLGRLGWLAREALPALVVGLNDPDAKVREAAAHAIGLMGPDALPTLTTMLAHADKYVRRKSVWAMGKLGPLAIPALADLCAALKDQDPRTGSGAAQALGNMGIDGAEAVPALAEAMRGTNIVLCRLAAKALSQIGTPAVATLIAHLQHSDPFVRGESALAIGWMGSAARSAVPFLASIVRGSRTPPTRPCLLQPAPFLPRADVETVDPDRIGSESPTPTESPGPVNDASSPEESCRIHAAQALGRIGPPAASALSDLREALNSGPEPLRRAAEQSIRQIQGA